MQKMSRLANGTFLNTAFFNPITSSKSLALKALDPSLLCAKVVKSKNESKSQLHIKAVVMQIHAWAMRGGCVQRSSSQRMKANHNSIRPNVAWQRCQQRDHQLCAKVVKSKNESKSQLHLLPSCGKEMCATAVCKGRQVKE
jgi:hypothetical protein